MWAQLRGYWTEAQGYQKFLYSVGFVLLASAVFHAGVLVVTGGSLEGDISWRKPILFGESFGLTAIFTAWVMTFLPKRVLAGWLLSLVLGLANVYEVVWVSFQQWRGVPSHFNDTTPFDQSLFALAGISIGFTGIVILVVTMWSLVRLAASPSFVWAIRSGLVLLALGQVFGIPMIQLGSHTFALAGNMKVPHAFSLHALQVLPVLAWLLSFADWSEARRTRIVVACTAGYCGIVAASAFQAFSGRAPLDLGPATASVLVVGVMSVVGTYFAAIWGLQQASA
jgi:hypothetical protein